MVLSLTVNVSKENQFLVAGEDATRRQTFSEVLEKV